LEASLLEIPKVEVYLKSNKHDVEVEAGMKKKIEASLLVFFSCSLVSIIFVKFLV